MVSLSDFAIRLALRERLAVEHAKEADTVLIEELGLLRGQVRLDIAVVNGLLHGYEIKSDRDSLRRLHAQVEVYGKILDRATLVVGDRFLHTAADLVPAWWGLLHARSTSRGLQLTPIKRPRKNPRRDARALVELLWSEHAMELLEQRNAARGVRGKSRCVVWERICDSFSLEEIAAAVRTRLKARAANPALA